MKKRVVRTDVPETGRPFNLCVAYGDLLFISGLPPFDEVYSAALRSARAENRPLPPFPDPPFETRCYLKECL